MDKLVEELKKILPESEVNGVASAINDMFESKTAELEKEYNSKLEQAYTELTGDLKEAEEIAERGYVEAHGIISELRTRLEIQGEEYQTQLEEGYGEAYQYVKAAEEKAKNLEVQLYEEYDGKLAEMKEYLVDKVNEFLQHKGQEFYEQAKKDVTTDSRMLEHKAAFDKIVEVTAQYMSNEDYNTVTNSKLEEAAKSIETIKGQLRSTEARNIRLANENTKLNENLRHTEKQLTESKQLTKDSVITEQKERIEKAKSVTGRGSLTNSKEKEVVIAENVNDLDHNISEMQLLAGISRK